MIEREDIRLMIQHDGVVVIFAHLHVHVPSILSFQVYMNQQETNVMKCALNSFFVCVWKCVFDPTNRVTQNCRPLGFRVVQLYRPTHRWSSYYIFYGKLLANSRMKKL